MNKKISQFNKEVISEFKELMKKCRNYEKEFILNSSKEKGLILTILNEDKNNQSFTIKNIDYIKTLILKNEIKCISKIGNQFEVTSKVYLFDDLLIVENLKKEDTYKVVLKEKILNLNDYDYAYETLDSFLNSYIEAD